MKLEDQVCSLKLATRLKQLGVKAECVFAWVDSGFGPAQLLAFTAPFVAGADEIFAAFTVAELGEMLKIQNMRHFFWHEKWVSENAEAMPGRPLETYLPVMHSEEAESEADARAMMLIHLIEKGLVKP